MSIVIDGTGTISGVSATGITTAQTVSASNITTGTLPSAQLPAGSVLQVINVPFTNYTNTNSTSFIDMTGATASITPKFSTSKILVTITLAGIQKNGGTGSAGACGSFQLLRNSTMIVSWDNYTGYTGSSSTSGFGQSCTNYLDSPATTSSTTYKVQWGSSGGATIQVNNYNGILGYSTSTITLTEIAA